MPELLKHRAVPAATVDRVEEGKPSKVRLVAPYMAQPSRRNAKDEAAARPVKVSLREVAVRTQRLGA